MDLGLQPGHVSTHLGKTSFDARIEVRKASIYPGFGSGQLGILTVQVGHGTPCVTSNYKICITAWKARVYCHLAPLSS